MLYDNGLATQGDRDRLENHIAGCINRRICSKCGHLISDSLCLCIGVFTCPNCGYENKQGTKAKGNFAKSHGYLTEDSQFSFVKPKIPDFPGKKVKQVYLAARYSRREELCKYRKELQDLGYNVQARWLDGNHQLYNGVPIRKIGENLVEGEDNPEANQLRVKFAQDDMQDCSAADIIINFTEPPRNTTTRGGRHVEFGIGLALGKKLYVVGPRENIFHWLPVVEVFESWDGLFKTLALDDVL